MKRLLHHGMIFSFLTVFFLDAGMGHSKPERVVAIQNNGAGVFEEDGVAFRLLDENITVEGTDSLSLKPHEIHFIKTGPEDSLIIKVPGGYLEHSKMNRAYKIDDTLIYLKKKTKRVVITLQIDQGKLFFDVEEHRS